MFRKNKKLTPNLDSVKVKVKFVIPQVSESTEGLKTAKDAFRKKEFVSSLYGTGIKDVISYHDNAKEGIDVTKAYDSFRKEEDRRITDEERLKKYGTMFPEFQQINIETAKEVYGKAITINKKNEVEKKKSPVSFSFIKEKENSIPNNNEDKNNHESLKSSNPFFDYVDTSKPKEDINNDNLELKGFSFDFDSLITDDSNQDIKSFEPVIEINETEDIQIPTDKPQVFSNIVKRSKEEIEEIYKASTHFEIKEDAIKEDKNSNNLVEETPLKPACFDIPKVVNPFVNYLLPPLDHFTRTPLEETLTPQWVLDKRDIINETLRSFDLSGEVTSFTEGPTFTRYEVLLQSGVNVRKIVTLTDTFQANLGVKTIRIQAPIPGKRTIGIEVPNEQTKTVWFGDIISDEFVHDQNPLNVALGKDIDGKVITTDITKWPHGLVAGATNSGKSVCINTILVSLLLKNKPDELKLILVDPKQVELIAYNDLPHLITPVISDAKMASHALKWTVEEMERRYTMFAHTRVRNIKDYNDKTKEDPTLQKMSYIVVVIDELADLMQVCGADVEESIQRITQKARAAGIHLIVATQRPTVDVVKGTIKANIPTRLAFRVFSKMDSLTILDEDGADSLLGKGDMLLKETDLPLRLQGAYIPDKEIDFVTDFIKKESTPDYIFDHSDLKQKFESEQFGGTQSNSESAEMLYQCAKFCIEENSCSINAMQQNFNLGFNRASRIAQALEEMGIVSEKLSKKGREVLVTLEQLDEIFER